MNRNEQNAIELQAAIIALANSPDHMNNFVSYLTAHFPEWIKKFANTPEGLANEFKEFANLKF